MLDVAWTELLVRGEVARENTAYLAVPNATYAVMKGDREAEPFKWGNDEKIRNVREA